MDILKLIKSQVEEAIAINSEIVGLESVITHVERAEHYLNKGKSNNDDHLYTDVIYRTNHAFEGILKEAYTALTGNDASKKTPNDIEKYFLTSKVLNARVVDLLKNYRQEWRNTSTHDYNLFFNQGEAFLAIVSVSAFIHVLLNQILDKIHFDHEKDKLKGTLSTIKRKLNKDYKKLDFIDKVSAIIQVFEDQTLTTHSEEENGKKEIEVINTSRLAREYISKIAAYVNSLDSTIKIELEPLIKSGDRRLRPDLIFTSKSGEQVIVEVNIARSKMSPRYLIHKTEGHLLSYMVHSGITNGIHVFVPYSFSNETNFVKKAKKIPVGGVDFNIIQLFDEKHNE